MKIDGVEVVSGERVCVDKQELRRRPGLWGRILGWPVVNVMLDGRGKEDPNGVYVVSSGPFDEPR